MPLLASHINIRYLKIKELQSSREIAQHMERYAKVENFLWLTYAKHAAKKPE